MNADPQDEQPLNIDTPIEKLTDFQKGVRAMFDALTFRAANHWHPHAMDQCNYDNKLIYEWAEDAMEEVSPADYTEWKSMNQMYSDGMNVGRAQAEAKKAEEVVQKEATELNVAIYIGCVSVFFMFFGVAALHQLSGWSKGTIFMTVSTAAIAFCTLIVTFQAWSAKRPRRNGFKPPYPMPPSSPPEGWTPKH
jgi:hypothetical protein